MIFVADENIDRRIVERLKFDGHLVEWVAEAAPSQSDEEVLRLALKLEALLLTEDKDFGELVYRNGQAHLGVLLIRLEGIENSSKAEIVSQAIRENEAEIPGAFVVISVHSIRIRRPANP